MYWNQRLGCVPQPSLGSVPAPAKYVDGVSDAEDNYLVLVHGDPQPQMNDGSPTNAVIDKLATPLPTGQEPGFVDGIDPSSAMSSSTTPPTASATVYNFSEDGCLVYDVPFPNWKFSESVVLVPILVFYLMQKSFNVMTALVQTYREANSSNTICTYGKQAKTDLSAYFSVEKLLTKQRRTG